MTTDALATSDQYLSSKEAGALLGYTHDYISKLCRDGKMAGVQRGRVWYVTEAEARAFQARHEAELEQKKAELSQKFSAIRQEHESVRKQADSQPEPVLVQEKPRIRVSEPVATAVALTETVDDQEEVQETAPVVQKSLQFVTPRHLVTAAVLGLLLLAPSMIREFGPSTRALSAQVGALSETAVISDVQNGMAAVVDTHTDLVRRTANVYSFVPHLADGYWQLALSAGELSKGTYSMLENLSDSYLTVYVLQGEIIYDSLAQIGDMGDGVLKGYELVGESFVTGGQKVIESYQNFFMVDEYVVGLKKK